MALPYGRYADTFTADTGRLPSGTIWNDAPVDAASLGHSNAMYYFNDFVECLSADNATVTLVDQAGWDATAATAGTALTTAATSSFRGGVWTLDAASTTAAQGIQVQQGRVAQWILTGTGPGEAMYYETRVRPVTTVTGEYAIGMFETDTTVIGSSAMSTSNGLGFTCVTDDGILLFDAEKATVRTTVTSNTLVAGTWVKLGFKVYSTGSQLECEFYVNGVPNATKIATANIPVVALRPTYVCQVGTTVQPGLDIDWVRVLHTFAGNT